jgi:hypothetical protein
MTKIFFSPLSFVAVFGSGMGKNQDRGSGINIPDPQQCLAKGFHPILGSSYSSLQAAPPLRTYVIPGTVRVV